MVNLISLDLFLEKSSFPHALYTCKMFFLNPKKIVKTFFREGRGSGQTHPNKCKSRSMQKCTRSCKVLSKILWNGYQLGLKNFFNYTAILSKSFFNCTIFDEFLFNHISHITIVIACMINIVQKPVFFNRNHIHHAVIFLILMHGVFQRQFVAKAIRGHL